MMPPPGHVVAVDDHEPTGRLRIPDHVERHRGARFQNQVGDVMPPDVILAQPSIDFRGVDDL